MLVELRLIGTLRCLMITRLSWNHGPTLASQVKNKLSSRRSLIITSSTLNQEEVPWSLVSRWIWVFSTTLRMSQNTIWNFSSKSLTESPWSLSSQVKLWTEELSFSSWRMSTTSHPSLLVLSGLLPSQLKLRTWVSLNLSTTLTVKPWNSLTLRTMTLEYSKFKTLRIPCLLARPSTSTHCSDLWKPLNTPLIYQSKSVTLKVPAMSHTCLNWEASATTTLIRSLLNSNSTRTCPSAELTSTTTDL